MKTKKCNCKRCINLEYMQQGMRWELLVNIVYCDKFPKGELQPKCCNQYEKIKGKNNG